MQVYFISVDKMQRAMKRFTGLTDGLWRVCGMRIAVPLLMEHQKYQVFSLDFCPSCGPYSMSRGLRKTQNCAIEWF